jgi:8-oxo-dGTP diphosphatase
MGLKITARGIVFHQGKLLCARLKPYRDASVQKSHDFWCTPGGGLDNGEAIIACVEREMVEETGIKPVIGNLLYVQQYAEDGTDYVEFFFHIVNSQDYLHIDLSKTTHGEQEIAEIDFVDPKSTYILPRFLSTEDIAAHISSNMPTKFFPKV